ncbi:hypothetical protein [Mucilaginibacter paludis]|uniref:Lipoprotein n=1 Tax=Mucilaginibacter paludis DSM 18603 TaxID=714943 RepID=H1YIE6_9SPHI|nr:hypothetical protein [Mucilaginibacter paludis]EHQ27559.1 hypothetical protein Mucpa_3460 [Mucilaginibacter paludis DSM 18603]
MRLFAPMAVGIYAVRLCPIIVTVACLFVACHQSPPGEWADGTKLLNYGYFTIEVPVSWQPVATKSIDSFTGEIHIDSSTVISFDFGWYSNSLDEDKECDRYMIEKGDVYIADTTGATREKKGTAVWLYYGKADSTNLQKLRLSDVKYTTINNHKAKLVIAKKAGQGTTGVYFDSLWVAGSDKDRFQLNSYNLSKEKQQELLTAIKTLKFYKHPITPTD